MTTFFPDISHFQAGLNLKGAPAVIAKATEGNDWRDASYTDFKAQAQTAGIPFAAYHYVDQADLQAQAQLAFSVIGPGIGTMWDAEAAGATVPRLVELTSRYRALGGNPTLVYFPYWWWRQLGSPDLRPLATAGLHLISSSYPPGGYSETGVGWNAYGGITPAIWQYTDAQAFNGQHVDFNAYKGTVDELRSLFEGGGDPTMTTVDPTNDTETEVLSILYAIAAGMDNATAHGKPWNVDLKPFWARIGKEAAAAIPAADHTHAVGETGPAVPTP